MIRCIVAIGGAKCNEADGRANTALYTLSVIERKPVARGGAKAGGLLRSWGLISRRPDLR
jgi:hypothetical protein